MPRTISVKQARYLLSKGSPLTVEQKKKFQKELHNHTVKIRKQGKKK